MLAGVAVIGLDGDFTQDTTFALYDTDVPDAVVPHLFVELSRRRQLRLRPRRLRPVRPHLAVEGRLSRDGSPRKKASLQSIYVQPNVALQITEGWSVGVGPVIGHSSVELVQAVDLSQQRTSATGPTFGQLGIAKRTEFARATLKGYATAFGVNVGVHGRIYAALGGRRALPFAGLLQVRRRRRDLRADVRPDSTLAANNPLGAPAGTPVDALLAPQFSGTGALTAAEGEDADHASGPGAGRLRLLGLPRTPLISVDYAWVGWKSFKELPVDFQGGATDRVLLENYNNTSSLRLGVEHRLRTAARDSRAGCRRGGGGRARRHGHAAPARAGSLATSHDRRRRIRSRSRFSVDGAYVTHLHARRRGRHRRARRRCSQTAEQLNSRRLLAAAPTSSRSASRLPSNTRPETI